MAVVNSRDLSKRGKPGLQVRRAAMALLVVAAAVLAIVSVSRHVSALTVGARG